MIMSQQWISGERRSLEFNALARLRSEAKMEEGLLLEWLNLIRISALWHSPQRFEVC